MQIPKALRSSLKTQLLITAAVLAACAGMGAVLPGTAQAATATPGYVNMGNCVLKGYVSDHWVPYNQTLNEPYYQTLSEGTSGNCVIAMQNKLNHLLGLKCFAGSAKITADGFFGPQTYTAVVNVQRNIGKYFKINGVTPSVDGSVGPQTWGILGGAICGTI